MKGLLVLLVMAALSGCLGAIPADVPIVLVEEALRLEGAGSAFVDKGWHCDRSHYDQEGPSAHLDPYSGRRPGILFIRPSTTNGSFVSIGSSFAHDAFGGNEGEVALRSIVEGGPTVANVSWADDKVEVDGNVLVVGEPREKTLRFAYGAGNVTEHLTFRSLGVGDVTTKRASPFEGCR